MIVRNSAALRTARLDLLPATIELCIAEAEGPDVLSTRLAASVPPSWPPPVFEPDDVARVRKQIEAEPGTPWTLHYLILRPSVPGGSRELIGVAGFVASPAPDGAVEIGYAVVPEHQRRGYATEVVQALLKAAFADPRVSMVTATTFPHLAPSIGVLTKSGFGRIGQPAANGSIRFERRR